MRPDASPLCFSSWGSSPAVGDSSSCRSCRRSRRQDRKSKDNPQDTDTDPCHFRTRRTSRPKRSKSSRRVLKRERSTSSLFLIAGHSSNILKRINLEAYQVSLIDDQSFSNLYRIISYCFYNSTNIFLLLFASVYHLVSLIIYVWEQHTHTLDQLL